LIQTSYITAVGATAAEIISAGVGLFQNEKRRQRIDARRDGIALRTFRRSLRDLFGQIPVSGNLIAEFLSATTGGKPFGQTIPIFDEFTKLTTGIADRNVRKVIEGMLKPIGVPIPIAKPISELAGQFQQ